MKTPVALPVVALLGLGPVLGLAGPKERNPFFRGAVYGKVLDDSGKPLAGATVVLVARTGKVLTWTKTGDDGTYALAANPKVALDIQPSKNRGLLMQCCNAATEVAMAPVKVVANMVANPGLTVAAAGVSIASGTPAPLEAQAIASNLPNHETVVQTQLATQGAVAAQAFGVGPKPTPRDFSTEGQADLLIEAPGFKKAALTSNAYWIEPPTDGSGKRIGLRAWIDPVKLAPTDGKGNAQVESEAFSLESATVAPSLVPAGDPVQITAKIAGPLDSDHPIRVFAREWPRNEVVELFPGKDKSVYEGSMTLDRTCSLGDATICIGALRAEPVEVKLNAKNNAALFRFVRRLDSMQAGQPYGYDPMVMASENRMDVKITVLSPKSETPPPAPQGPSKNR
jgi:hypothetical protein